MRLRLVLLGQSPPRDFSSMSQQLSIMEMHRLTGFAKDTVARKLEKIPFEKAGNARLFDSEVALRALYLGDGEELSPQDRLANARTETEKLDQELKRKERIPKSDVKEINETAFSNMAAILRSREDKVLTAVAIEDLISELRKVADYVESD